MAQDSASTSNATRHPAGAPAARLAVVRARLAELRSSLTRPADDAPTPAPVIWPRDLCAGPLATGAWGADPTEVADG